VSINPLGSGFVSEGNTGNSPNPDPSEYTDTLISNSGAMGDLYCRTYKASGMREVVKRIKQNQVNNPEFRNLFIQEFANLRQLCHENIVAAKAQGEDNKGPWYTMEYIEGKGLDQIIRNKEIRAVEEKIEILTQILNGLQYVHRNGLIHRDLKPENIMVANRNRNVKIIDFGLAISDSFAQKLKLAGSKKYMSPEQKINSSTIDQQSDIYSFGLIMVEFFTGQFSTVALGISDPQLRKIADKCLSPTKIARYRNCGEIIGDLNIKKSDIPDEVTRLIDEIAADGKVTDAERKYLNAMIQKHNLDANMVYAMLDFKVEKALPVQPTAAAPTQNMPTANTQTASGVNPQPANKKTETPAKKKRVKWGAVLAAIFVLCALIFGIMYLLKTGQATVEPAEEKPIAENKESDSELAWKYYEQPDRYKDAVEIFKRMSQSNDAATKIEGLRGLALCYAYGKGTTLSPAVALQYIDKALDIDPKSIVLLDTKGEVYTQTGNYLKANEYWEICQDKDPEYVKRRTRLTEYFVWIDEGDQYYNQGRYDDAVKSYQRAADMNNPRGMCYIGDCYMEGKGVQKDPNMAFDYYQKAANCRLPEAMLKLGKCYLNGTGTERDRGTAKYWVKQAADLDYQEAKNLIQRI